MRRNIFAFTPAGSGYYPEYLSVNREPDGSVTVTVRAPAEGGQHGSGGIKCGKSATMTVPAEQWRKLIAALALEPDLWPGCDCAIKQAQAKIGKPHGEPLA